MIQFQSGFFLVSEGGRIHVIPFPARGNLCLISCLRFLRTRRFIEFQVIAAIFSEQELDKYLSLHASGLFIAPADEQKSEVRRRRRHRHKKRAHDAPTRTIQQSESNILRLRIVVFKS